jgi:PAS domain S-box-containing protein
MLDGGHGKMGDAKQMGAVAEALGIDDAEIARRKDLLEFTEADAALLKRFHELLKGFSDDFAHAFCNHLLGFPELKPVLAHQPSFDGLEQSLKLYFDEITAGEYDSRYVLNRLGIGVTHQHLGLERKWCIGAYRKCLSGFLPELLRLCEGDDGMLLAIHDALHKIAAFDLGLVLDAYGYADRQAAMRLEKRMRYMMEGIDAIVWEVDASSFGFSYVSPQAEKILGYPVAHWEKYFDLKRAIIIPEDYPAINALCIRELSARRNHEMEYRAHAADGHLVWIQERVTVACNADGEIASFLGVMTDVTQVREEQRRLQEVEEHLNAIVGSLDDVVWSLNPETFQTVYMSPGATKVYGVTVEDFYRDSKLWQRLLHPEDAQRVLKKMDLIYEHGMLELDYRITRPDGIVRWIHDQVRLVRDDDGKALRLDGISVDITQHKLAEENMIRGRTELEDAYRKLQDVQGQLMQSEKMASIGQLAAGVAHEINNPIGYVHSNLGSLQKYLDDLFAVVTAYEQVESLLDQHPEALASLRLAKQKADLEFLKEDVAALMNESREGITRVKKIVQDLKDFSHVGSDDEWVFADLHQGVDSTLSIVWNEIKYKAEVSKEYGDIPNVECLPAQLNQVFMNLLVNAAHAIEERGVITVRSGTSDSGVWVEVADTGKGIAPADISRIFDPFFTTKPIGKGTGLGLSVSYSIVQKHHGSINVASELGQGTTFRVWLPLRQPRGGDENNTPLPHTDTA